MNFLRDWLVGGSRSNDSNAVGVLVAGGGVGKTTLSRVVGSKLNSHDPNIRSADERVRWPGSETSRPCRVCCRPRFHPQSFQPGTSSLHPRELQTQSLRRFGRVASTCSLRVLGCWFYWSDQVSLTMPWASMVHGFQQEIEGNVPRLRGTRTAGRLLRRCWQIVLVERLCLPQ